MDNKIRTALISVFYKEGLEPVVKLLHSLNITLYSTGGTQLFIEALDIPVIPVENITSFPSILGGRVKTLHPKIFGGILMRRNVEEDLLQISEYEIPEIDLVIVDLYPFEETIIKKSNEAEIIEKIDIGGVSLIRAAAKNFKDVTVVSHKKQYQMLIEHLVLHNGSSTLEYRKSMAVSAFALTSNYDSLIFNHFNHAENQPYLRISKNETFELRYGENPHQQGVYWGNFDEIFLKISGKQLSYNNILDVDAALNMIEDFEANTCIILKHNNACGIATCKSVLEAWHQALSCDNISAFGGIIIFNNTVDEETASQISNLFFEVLIAPKFTSQAIEILTKKPNRIILVQKKTMDRTPIFRSALNGILQEEKDVQTEGIANLNMVTEKQATEQEKIDLIFAAKVAKHSKSNTIVLAKNEKLMASGVGQTSRVDALKQAIEKAVAFGFDLNGAVMASDAFFPFPDCVEIAHKAGITAIVQPGGSMKDKDSIDYCNLYQIAMATTGFRHFKH